MSAVPPGAEQFTKASPFDDWRRDKAGRPHPNGEAAGGGRHIIDPKAPFKTAKQFLDQGYTVNEVHIVHYHRGGFYNWDGCCYPEIDDATLRSQLYAYLDQCFVQDKKGELQAVKPNRAMVLDVLDGMRAAAHLDAKITAPAWLSGEGKFPSEESVACKNGLLHLPTMKLLPSTPDFFTHNALDFAFDPNAPQPKQWLEFLNQLWPNDHEARNTLQEIFGYCLMPDTSQQKAFLLIGPKRSGKGTIARILTRLTGTANCVAPTLAGLGTNFGVAPLIGKRVAIISDARLSGKADQHAIAERLLSITGEDNLTIDRKYQPAWTGQLQTRFVILSNELPRLSDTSGALASRFIILLMTESFYGREDHALTGKLVKELPGILNWTITGWKRLQSFGYFVQPKSALDAVQQLEDLTSPIGAFVREKCAIGAGFSVGIDTIFGAWVSWCESQGRNYPGNKQTFGKDLRAAVPSLRLSSLRDGCRRTRYYEGIKLG